ncbi:MAG TPA: D-aminoacylase [Candidatus Limnocylindrales bacterium]|nr:D-aminoacylase [Candidatus Limnocylindrales bacterium]
MTKKSSFVLSGILTGLVLFAGFGIAQHPRYDFIISGAHIVDGTGAPWVEGDIGIVGDRIAEIGDLSKASATKRLNAAGLVVSPGFIDVQGQSEFNVLVDNRVASKITQGVTTEITGEGSSIAPINDRMRKEGEDVAKKYDVRLDWLSLAEYFNHFERTKSGVNLGTFVGAGGIRNYVMGTVNRPASSDEIEQMRLLIAQAMKDGAFGVSTALEYVPDTFASTDEIVELAKVAREFGGVYFTHQRSESDRIFESLDEVFSISERAKISTTIWHLKAAYSENWGRMPEVLRRIEEARARGIDVAASVYPYTRASNGLIANFPPWVSEGGTDKMIARLKDPAQRERIKKEMEDPAGTWENEWRGSGGPSGILLIQVLNPDLVKYEGMTLEEVGRQMNKDPRDAAMDIAIADRGRSAVVISIMDEADVRAAVSHPIITFGSDSEAQAEEGPLSKSKAHPRAFGTFPRVLGQYVREQHTMRLEDAVRKMTSLAASRVGVMDRGVLRPGMFADIALFDPRAIKDVATYNDPLHYSQGIRFVFVNGRPVIWEGSITEERPGRALRGPGYRPAP